MSKTRTILLAALGCLALAAVLLAAALPGSADGPAAAAEPAADLEEEDLEDEEERLTLETIRSVSFTDLPGSGPAQDAARYAAYLGIMEGSAAASLIRTLC